ncbi:hypothetical protein DFJ58DRAFT_918311 [Suillus subalutaceus]|uniref:uncharacterized protein n=1 Tax=Suillus subalutaceus TaxID=48586 RepID=UPI001B880DAE|nr:uncharacterized protein DFJ58DRAFT_918311 [Suillus subalutaceus]KAG1830926.1 hypothetical protein DFJ58DRAFT_918311 [Suillus subalutaceus]
MAGVAIADQPDTTTPINLPCNPNDSVQCSTDLQGFNDEKDYGFFCGPDWTIISWTNSGADDGSMISALLFEMFASALTSILVTAEVYYPGTYIQQIPDVDRSGTIAFNEFCGLWKYIKDWQNVFRHFDRDRSGTIDRNELREALHQCGFNLSPPLIELVQVKYDIKASNVASPYGPTPGITFDRFVRACVVIVWLSSN